MSNYLNMSGFQAWPLYKCVCVCVCGGGGSLSAPTPYHNCF